MVFVLYVQMYVLSQTVLYVLISNVHMYVYISDFELMVHGIVNFNLISMFVNINFTEIELWWCRI